MGPDLDGERVDVLIMAVMLPGVTAITLACLGLSLAVVLRFFVRVSEHSPPIARPLLLFLKNRRALVCIGALLLLAFVHDGTSALRCCGPQPAAIMVEVAVQVAAASLVLWAGFTQLGLTEPDTSGLTWAIFFLVAGTAVTWFTVPSVYPSFGEPGIPSTAGAIALSTAGIGLEILGIIRLRSQLDDWLSDRLRSSWPWRLRRSGDSEGSSAMARHVDP